MILQYIPQKDSVHILDIGCGNGKMLGCLQEKDKIYDIEVQRSTAGADVHRARFNSSMLDMRMLKEKQKFKELHESYVIFITENDVMGDCLPFRNAALASGHTVKGRCQNSEKRECDNERGNLKKAVYDGKEAR